jgi:hypothetical protein
MLRRLEQAKEENLGGSCGRLHMHLLQNAGHWLQADNPEGLTKLMLRWFKAGAAQQQ